MRPLYRALCEPALLPRYLVFADLSLAFYQALSAPPLVRLFVMLLPAAASRLFGLVLRIFLTSMMLSSLIKR